MSIFHRDTIDDVLSEGRSWVSRLEASIERTTEKVSEVNRDIDELVLKRDILSNSISEGSEIADNFKQLLRM